MKNDLKKKYIQAAFEIVRKEGRKGVSIRRLAKELNCNVASLYRCFQDLDELLLYAGLKYVEDYLHDLQPLLDQPVDNMKMFLNVWKCFAEHSFRNPKMYNSLFFGKYSEKLSYATEEYYTRLFPGELVQFDEEARVILMRGNFATGDATTSRVLNRCVDDGLIREEDRLYIDKLCLQIYKGYLKDFIDGRVGQEDIGRVTDELNNYFSTIISKYKL